MNEVFHRHPSRVPTQAAEGVPRWRWTTAELLRLKELGAFTDEDRFELIGGEIVPMSPKGRRHEVIADLLNRHWSRRLPQDIWVGCERQFNLDEDTYTCPDLIVGPEPLKAYDLRGDTALLVVEVAETSLDYDIKAKAEIYAVHGVREYWVIDARTLMTFVHCDPGPEGYASRSEVPGEIEIVPHLAPPTLAVRLADLDLD